VRPHPALFEEKDGGCGDWRRIKGCKIFFRIDGNFTFPPSPKFKRRSECPIGEEICSPASPEKAAIFL
jgi:hypothetical protein